MLNLNKSSSRIPHLYYDQDPPVGIEIEVCLHVVTVSALLTVSIPDRMPSAQGQCIQDNHRSPSSILHLAFFKFST